MAVSCDDFWGSLCVNSCAAAAAVAVFIHLDWTPVFTDDMFCLTKTPKSTLCVNIM